MFFQVQDLYLNSERHKTPLSLINQSREIEVRMDPSGGLELLYALRCGGRGGR